MKRVYDIDILQRVYFSVNFLFYNGQMKATMTNVII